LAGSSPVAISQIVALAVDNAASGADVQFIFPDSGFVLSVPSRTSGVFPVFTNALMFYASAPSAIAGDRTVFQAFNSMPPPVPIPPSQAQNQAGLGSVSMNANSTTPLVPAGINGTLQSLTISASGIATGTGVANVFVRDGTGANLWTGSVLEPNGTLNLALTGLGLRFVNGLNFVIANSTLSSGFATVNAYYSTP
jgi:hypothetical protein